MEEQEGGCGDYERVMSSHVKCGFVAYGVNKKITPSIGIQTACKMLESPIINLIVEIIRLVALQSK